MMDDLIRETLNEKNISICLNYHDNLDHRLYSPLVGCQPGMHLLNP